MARELHKLTALKVAKASKAGYVGDGGGLALQVSESGAKSWIFRFQLHGKPREMGLGSVNTFALAEAREWARLCRQLVQQKIDPIEHRRQTVAANLPRKVRTFKEVAAEYIATKAHEWRSTKHGDQWAATLERHVYPVFGSVPVDQVARDHVMQALKPLWTTTTETASRVRNRVELILNFAVGAGYRTEGPNPAAWRGGLDAVLPKPSKVKKVEHHPAIAIDAMHEFMQTLRAVDGVAARCLEFVALTACRSGEARGAMWSEFDLGAGLWVVPGARTKSGREFRVALSKQAVALVNAMPKMADSPFVFAAARGGALSDMALSMTMRRMDLGGVPHGLRSSFRDWAAERSRFPAELAELALGHAVGTAVEQAYRRSDLFEKRRALAQAWCDFVDQPRRPATVTPIAKGHKKAAA